MAKRRDKSRRGRHECPRYGDGPRLPRELAEYPFRVRDGKEFVGRFAHRGDDDNWAALLVTPSDGSAATFHYDHEAAMVNSQAPG